MSAKNYSDPLLLQMLKGKQWDEALEYIYNNQEWRNNVKTIIRNNGSDISMFEDHYMDTLVNFERNIRLGKFGGGSSLKTYFVAIAKRLLWTKTRKSSRIKLQEQPIKENALSEENPEIEFLSKEKRAFIDKLLGKMDKDCAVALRMWRLDYKMPEIEEKLDIERGNARRVVYRCKDKLRKIIENHPNLLQALRDIYGKL